TVRADDGAERVRRGTTLRLRLQQRLARLVRLEPRAKHVRARAGAHLHATLRGFLRLLRAPDARLRPADQLIGATNVEKRLLGLERHGKALLDDRRECRIGAGARLAQLRTAPSRSEQIDRRREARAVAVAGSADGRVRLGIEALRARERR